MEDDLPQTRANHVPLSPVSFLARAARIWPGRTAIIHGERRITYAAYAERSRRLASALRHAGVAPGDVVAALLPNTPAMLEAHMGVPMAHAVLCPINTRLDAPTVRFILGHSGAKLLLLDREFAAVAVAALDGVANPPRVVIVDDGVDGAAIDATPYEDFIATGDAAFPVEPPGDEWAAISLSYTSGTTGDPKGVVVHHRGAYLNACGNALAFGLSAQSVYLWTIATCSCGANELERG